MPFCSSCSSHGKPSSSPTPTEPNRHVGQGRPPPELERVLWNGSALPLSNVIMHAVRVTKATITSQGCDAQNSPCARNNRPTLIFHFTHNSLSNLHGSSSPSSSSSSSRCRRGQFVGTHLTLLRPLAHIREDLAPGGRRTTVNSGAQATPRGASTSSPQHCSGDTEEEDARARPTTARRSDIFAGALRRLLFTRLMMMIVPRRGRGRDQHHYPPPPESMWRLISRNS